MYMMIRFTQGNNVPLNDGSQWSIINVKHKIIISRETDIINNLINL